jgi:glycosyltransferase involved in cell wall biosynthesis
VAPEPSGVFVATADQFSQAVARLTSLGSAERHELGRLNREFVCREFAWEALSVRAGEAIEALHAAARTPHPVQSILTPPRVRVAIEAESKRIGIVSTFDIKCGIASYTEDFVEGLDDINCQAHVFLSDPMHAERLNSYRRKTSTAWFYDDLYFKHSVIDPGFIIEQARRRNLSHVNTQYHLGFFDFEQLLGLLDSLRAAQISSSVTLHNSLALSQEQLSRLGMTETKILVHDAAEVERIQQVAEVELLPFGVNAAPQEGTVDRLTVGTFGFLRPHKGLYELLRAFDIVRAAEPRARLRAYCAKYPSGDSESESSRCAALIDELGLRDHVTLDTSFLPKEEVLRLLAVCDVNILPYHDVNEGSSAAANYCIAARRPLITSRSRIFEPLADVPYRLERVEPGPIALAILGLLRNDKLKALLQGRIDRLADERDWREVAAHFLDVVAA